MNALETERPMPQAPEAERAVLGSVLYSTKALARIANILLPADFSRDAHRAIYEAMLAIDNDGEIVDFVPLRLYLADRGQLDAVGGAAYLSGLTEAVPDVANVERYAALVKRKAQMRELVVIGSALARDTMGNQGEAPAAIAARYTEALQLIRPHDATEALMDMENLAGRVEELYENGGVRTGESTGWPSLDELYRVQRGAWTLISGIPGHGKTNVLDNLMINLARRHQWQAVMFSAENYPAEAHVASLIEKYLGEPFGTGPSARMRRESMKQGLAFVERYVRFVDPAAERMTIDRLLALASTLHERQRIDVLTIDPWNELHHDRAKELSETEYISVCLTKVRRWARAHDAHVFLVAHPQKMQKDRDTGKYGVPTPYDVSGSAHWRNKADYCLTVYRDITEGDAPEVSIHVQKVRRREMGRIGSVTLRYDKVTGEYTDPSVKRGGTRELFGGAE